MIWQLLIIKNIESSSYIEKLAIEMATIEASNIFVILLNTRLVGEVATL